MNGLSSFINIALRPQVLIGKTDLSMDSLSLEEKTQLLSKITDFLRKIRTFCFCRLTLRGKKGPSETVGRNLSAALSHGS